MNKQWLNEKYFTSINMQCIILKRAEGKEGKNEFLYFWIITRSLLAYTCKIDCYNMYNSYKKIKKTFNTKL